MKHVPLSPNARKDKDMTIIDLARRHAALYLSRGQLPVSDDDPLVRAFQKCIDEASDERGEYERQRDLLLNAMKRIAQIAENDCNTFTDLNKNGEFLAQDARLLYQISGDVITECEKGEQDG